MSRPLYRTRPLGNIKTGEMKAAFIIQRLYKGKYVNCLKDGQPWILPTKSEAFDAIQGEG